MTHPASAGADQPGSADRYARQVAFRGIGRAGQQRLGEAAVAVVGCGATGAVIAEQLVRAGIGRLKMIDRDYVEWGNLHRQTLYDEDDARAVSPKAVAGAQRLAGVNSTVCVEPHVVDVHAGNVEALIGDVDLVLDGTDNFDTRFLLNDACAKAGTPWVYCAAVGSSGMTMTIVPGRSACLRCLLPEPPAPGSLPTCASAGVVNAITGLMGSIASAEAIKLLVGSGEPNHALLSVDVWDGSFTRLSVARRSDCPTCDGGRYEHLEAQVGLVAEHLCGNDSVQLRPQGAAAMDLSLLAGRLRAVGDVHQNEFLLRFRVGGREIVVFHDGRAMVRGVDDPVAARRFYDEYIGS